MPGIWEMRTGKEVKEKAGRQILYENDEILQASRAESSFKHKIFSEEFAVGKLFCSR